jgi:hypothetical protein
LDYPALRDAIAADLVNDLGTYTFPDGNTAPAIRLEIGNMGKNPEGTTCDGLEVVVVAIPTYTLTPIVGGKQLTTRAVITLKMWDRERSLLIGPTEAPLDQVLETLQYLDIDISPTIKGVPQFEQLGNIETATIEVSTMVSHA